MTHRPPRAAWCLVACATLLALAACSSSGPKELTKRQKLGFYLENAARWFALGDIDRAQDQAERGLKVDPGNERFLLIRGTCLQLRGTYDDIVEGEQVFRSHPAQNDYRVQLGLAGCLERKGDYLEATGRQIAAGDRYTDAPDPTARASELGASASAYWEEAFEHYVKAEELFTGDLDALNGLVRTTTRLERFDESLAFSRKLLATLDASTRLLKSTLAEQKAKGDSTVTARKQLLSNEDLEAEVRMHVADLYQRMKDLPSALAELDQVLALQPERAEVHARRGQILFEQAAHGRARSALERYLQLSVLPFDNPEIRRTYDMIDECNRALGEVKLGGN